MKIIKYKKASKNIYKVFLEDREISLYEDIILKNDILLKRQLTLEEINKYLNENKFYEAYYKAVKYISIKMRCKKEIKNYLKDFDDIDKVIAKLEKEKLLDEKRYIKAYIADQINLKNVGPNKIKKELLALELNENIIDEELKIFTPSLIKEKISKRINKALKTNKKSLYIFKNKLKIDLYNLGFDKDYIEEALSNIDIDESLLREAEYEKLKNKYSKKYSGEELEYYIKQKLYQKGFR